MNMQSLLQSLTGKSFKHAQVLCRACSNALHSLPVARGPHQMSRQRRRSRRTSARPHASAVNSDSTEVSAAVVRDEASGEALDAFLNLSELLCIAAAGGLQVAVLLAQQHQAPTQQTLHVTEGRSHRRAVVHTQAANALIALLVSPTAQLK